MEQRIESFYESVTFSRAEASRVWGQDGKEYIDFSCGGAFCAAVGHNNRHLVKRMVRARLTGVSACYRFRLAERDEYLARLCELTGFEHAVMFSSGTEATEAAWRVMRKSRGKDGILGMDDAFHGKTLGAQIMAGAENERGGKDYRWGVPEAAAGIIMEPYRAYDAQWHSEDAIMRVLDKAKAYNLLLTLDEIQGGFYRTGKLFGYHHYVDLDGELLLKPDLVCVGKAAFNGFPASVLLGPKWMDDPRFGLSSTHGGHPLAVAAGMGVLDALEHITVATADDFKIMLHAASHLASGHVQYYNQEGLLAAVIFDDAETAMRVAELCLHKGLITIPTGRNAIKLAPALNIGPSDLREGMEILGEVLNDLKV